MTADEASPGESPEKRQEENDNDGCDCGRRSFLSRVGWSVLTLSGLSVSDLLSQAVQEAPPNLVGDTTNMKKVDVTMSKFRSIPVAVVKNEESVRVLSAVCTHQSCTIEWNSRAQRLQCPCHGGEYDLEGKVVSGPPPSQLIEYPHEVRDGKVYIVLEDS